MDKKILQKVNSPKDLKSLTLSELSLYAKEVREYILEVVNNNGGHLASNLGAVELSIAIHRVFDCPNDKILWDVGHQSYTHKIITGRRDDFALLRKDGGICGFPNMNESIYDSFTMGHSSTSLSVGLGFARANLLKKSKDNVVCIIGDGALSGGMAFEALDDIGISKAKMLIILNDNEMSISKNVGAISEHLANLRLSKGYAKFKSTLRKGVSSMPFFGEYLVKGLENTKEALKSFVISKKMFENLGIKYYGAFDGHNISNMLDIFSQVKNINSPTIIHLITKKGYGYTEAEGNPSYFHGVDSKFTTKNNSFSGTMGNKLVQLAEKNDKITAITAAMTDGTGLTEFSKKFPNRFFDVAIAEQHAVSLAAGLAASGLKPYFAVYSSFLQRAYDQILHDVCINNLPVTFLIDRAGIVGTDGVTHQGTFDLSYLKNIPNMTIATPSCGSELEKLLEWSAQFNAPLAIRYPKSYSTEYETAKIEHGKWNFIKKSDSNVYLLCAGNRMLDIAMQVKNANIINCLFIKPLDFELLDSINHSNNIIITLEDNVKMGGFGESVVSYCSVGKKGGAMINSIGWQDDFINTLDIQKALDEAGFNIKTIEKISAKMS